MADTSIEPYFDKTTHFMGIWQDAKLANAPTYIDGKTCGRGHTPTIRRTSNRTCIACQKMKADEWLGNNLERRKEWRKSYTQDNAERIKLVNANWVKNNYERHVFNCETWKSKNPERYNAAVQAANLRNKERNSLRWSLWSSANKDRRAETTAVWAKNNPTKRCANEAKRRARKMGSTGSFSYEDINYRHKNQRGRCAYCRTSLRNGYHIDHIMPLALGGSNDRRNLQLLCGPCNLRKGAKHPIDFVQQRFGLLI